MRDIEYLKKYYKGDINLAIKKLESGIPVQYIVGNVDFCGYTMNVNENVLIPRFETEGLIEIALDYLSNTNIDVVDLGCGSGCIAITLKKKLPNINMDAVDISNEALTVARSNALLNNADITFYNGDMLKPLNKKYDCIISNPPYIAYDEEIMDIVKNNEPHLALYADNNGLYFYEEIIKSSNKNLKSKNIIAFEIGEKQGEEIKQIALSYFPNSKVIVEKDLQNRDRFVFVFNNL